VAEDPVCPSCARRQYRDGTPWGPEGLDKAKAKDINEECIRCERIRREIDEDVDVWDDMDAQVDVQRSARAITLRRYQVVLGQEISESVLDAECVQRFSQFADTVKLELRGFIWAEPEHLRQYEFKKPATWWQHFKERLFPSWMRVRWPVRYVTEVVNVDAIYPEFKQAVPKDRAGLAVLILNRKGSS